MAGHTYNDIISLENLLIAWREFLRGKRKRKDVALFSVHLMDNILTLHKELIARTYRHGSYHAFKISDPKPRDIHKATVRDRLLHHAIYRILYPYFDRKFIFDSFSCRRDKGTHRAINRFREYIRIVSHNHARTVWVLKCDIKKFFANIDHAILISILKKYIPDQNIIWLLERVMSSFSTSCQRSYDRTIFDNGARVGLPLGNLTSQLLVNIYMNEFDQFVKRKLKAVHYIRYADDFVILHKDFDYLRNLIPQISEFLGAELKLAFHPKKLSIATIASGVDFLGWVHFPHHRVPRTSTKRRMMKNLQNNPKEAALVSYIGLLSHGDTYNLARKIKIAE